MVQKVPASSLENAGGNFKNLIINGDMSIFQRATSATTSTSTYDTVDRFLLYESSDGEMTSEKEDLSVADQATTGQRTALEMNVTTADGTIAANQFAAIYHRIEAQNLQHLLYGTSAAKNLTLSFWCKSNKTGTYCISFNKNDSTEYFIPIEYTISSANTWEKKVIHISPTAGSTSLITASGGAIADDNGVGLQITFGLAWGSNYHGTNNTWTTSSHLATSNQVNWLDSTSNNFYLTGVQLEVGSGASDFEHLPFDVQLRRCQRYFYRTPDGGDSGTSSTHQHLGNGYIHNSTLFIGHIVFPEVMRAAPTCSFAGEVRVLDSSGGRDPGSNITMERPTSRSVQPQATISGATQGQGAALRLVNDADGYIQADAEL
jgi:hypothetical protein